MHRSILIPFPPSYSPSSPIPVTFLPNSTLPRLPFNLKDYLSSSISFISSRSSPFQFHSSYNPTLPSIQPTKPFQFIFTHFQSNFLHSISLPYLSNPSSSKQPTSFPIQFSLNLIQSLLTNPAQSLLKPTLPPDTIAKQLLGYNCRFSGAPVRANPPSGREVARALWSAAQSPSLSSH